MSLNKTNVSGTTRVSSPIPIRSQLIIGLGLDAKFESVIDDIILNGLIGEEVTKESLEERKWFPKLWTATERINWVHNYNMMIRRMRQKYRG